MRDENVYINKYEKAKTDLVDIIVCLCIGALIAYVYYEFVGTFYIESTYVFLVMPYGIKKTWNSLLVMRAGSMEMWFMWFFYMAIKLLIAVVYGAIGVPVCLINDVIQICAKE
ncbi:MAG: hypothetical protein J6J16_07145 [Lachnospiraceae bacterium]|nr:hypothetical protein [Lachnospiraceae bacterium]